MPWHVAPVLTQHSPLKLSVHASSLCLAQAFTVMSQHKLQQAIPWQAMFLALHIEKKWPGLERVTHLSLHLPLHLLEMAALVIAQVLLHRRASWLTLTHLCTWHSWIIDLPCRPAATLTLWPCYT